MPRTRNSSMVRAKEAIVIVVGARPIEYQRIRVRDRRTGDLVDLDAHEAPPADEGDEGIPYAFKADEKVRRDHPAVKENPGAFAPIDNEDDE